MAKHVPVHFSWSRTLNFTLVINHGLPITLIELKAGAFNFDAMLDQALGYSRTVMGRHAGLQALSVLMLSETGFYFGVLHWDGFCTLKFKVCIQHFKFDGYHHFDRF